MIIENNETPLKLIMSPRIANLANFRPWKVIITIHSKTAFKIAPNPLLMNFTPQVLSPLLKAKLRMLKMMIVFHCFPGQASFYTRKGNVKYPINCLIPASCNGGICLTPFEAIHVVPQNIRSIMLLLAVRQHLFWSKSSFYFSSHFIDSLL
jgi:hypothetical protein